MISEVPNFKHRFEAATVQVKKKAIRGLVARDVVVSLIWGSMFLVLGGITYGLATIMSPALAAVGLGGLILVIIAFGVYFGTKYLEKR